MSAWRPLALCEISGTGLPAEVRVACLSAIGVIFLNAEASGLLYELLNFFSELINFFLPPVAGLITSWLSSLPE